MNSTTYSEFEEWLPRPAALKLGLAVWIAGLVVAGAAALHTHGRRLCPTRSRPRRPKRRECSSFPRTSSSDTGPAKARR